MGSAVHDAVLSWQRSCAKMRPSSCFPLAARGGGSSSSTRVEMGVCLGRKKKKVKWRTVWTIGEAVGGGRKGQRHRWVVCAAGSGCVVGLEEGGDGEKGGGLWAVLQSVLPYGKWWEVGAREEEESKGGSLRRAVSRLLCLMKPDKGLLAVAFASLVVAALSEISIPHFVAATIFSAQSGSVGAFKSNVQLLGALSCLYGLFSGLRGACFGVANQILVRRMREKLYKTLLTQDMEFFDKESVGGLTSRLGSDCQQVSRIIGNDLNIMLRNGLQGIGSLIYLTTLSWHLALSSFTICLLMWCLMMVYGQYQRHAAKAAQDTLASANQVAEESLSLVRLVRTFGTEPDECHRYSKWCQQLEGINTRQNVAYGIWTWSSNTLYNATQVVALVLGGAFVMKGFINAEQLTKFILYSEWVVHSTWWVGNHWASLMQALGASEKVLELMDLAPSKEMVVGGGEKLGEVKGCIQFKDVCFRYPARPQVMVLRSVSFTVYPGELVAVVGLSGSGKSTLIGLLLHHYEPQGGIILVDGVPLNALDMKWFRQQLGVVSQEPRLFSMDIASNIAYGCERSVSELDIEMAARQANAHDFIQALPDGYRTLVDNVRLSGGQKQRIAIARALVRRPSILILDEATSALDSESEHLVQKAMDQAMRGAKRKRTVLVIAHRLSTIQAADRIIVMHQGQVVESGSHDHLISLGGQYATLTQRQLTSLP